MSGPGNGNEQQIWLSREGKTEGPFSPSQVESMKSSGEYKKYTWIWSAKSKNWEPIYPAPPPPALPKKTETAKKVNRELAAVCHDNRVIVGGIISSAIGNDSIMKTSDYGDMLPPFKKGHKVIINLLDEDSGVAENAKAEIVDFKKTGSSWEYRLKWSDTPKLLQA
jgi:hypothetical protein